MIRPAALGLLLVASLAPSARPDDAEAKTIAQTFLDKGSALYDAKDVAGLVATYTDDAQVIYIGKESITGDYKETIKRGRDEVEALYRDLFKDVTEKTTSRNVVDFARLVAPDLLVVQGTFQLDTTKPETVPFVQVRIKRGGRWLLKTLHLFLPTP
jgi:ketosteroid isomerase-like protein